MKPRRGEKLVKKKGKTKRNETRNGRYAFPPPSHTHCSASFLCFYLFIFCVFPNVAVVAVMSFFIFIFPLATFFFSLPKQKKKNGKRNPLFLLAFLPYAPFFTPFLHCLQAASRSWKKYIKKQVKNMQQSTHTHTYRQNEIQRRRKMW